MPPSSKRHLFTLGSLVCIAIALLGLTEYFIQNAARDKQLSDQFSSISNRLSSSLQTSLIREDSEALGKILASEFPNSDLQALTVWSPNHERLLYGLQAHGDTLAQVEKSPTAKGLLATSFTIHANHTGHTEALAILDMFIDLGAIKKRNTRAAWGTALKTSAVAFPLLYIAILILNKQEKDQIQTLKESITRSRIEERTHNQNILEGTEAGTWDWELQTGTLSLNERWGEMIGYTLDELEPISLSTWEKTVHPEDLKICQKLIEQHLSGILQYYDVEFRQKHKDGSWRWINARGKIVQWTEDGIPLRMSGTHLDITERKVAEQANQASRQLLESVFRAASGISVIATDTHGTITLFNPGSERMLGYRADEMVGKTTPFILHLQSELEARGIPLEDVKNATPDDYMARVLKVGQENPEWTYVRKDGKLLSVTLSITPTHDDTGALTGYLGAAMDISGRKQVEVELYKSRSMLQKVLDTIPVRVFWKDNDSVYLGANQLFADDAGQSTSDLIGKTDFELSWPEHAEAFRKDDVEVIQSGQSKLNIKEPQRRPDGSVHWLRTSKIPLRDEADNTIGVLGTYEDITRLKKTQEDLIQAKEAAEAASIAKDEFLAVMSHEMRTPLNPILGFSNILRQSITSNPEAEYIDTIINAANRQLHLIDDILEYMRINSGQIKPSTELFSLTDLCHLAVSDAQSTTSSLELRFEQNDDENINVDSDLMMLRRILDNLLNNACKYTNEGHITLRLSRSTTQRGVFTIAVTDTGIGIDAQNQKKLFDAFSQADSSYTRNHEGLGLGLAICKKLLVILGGTISVDSQIGYGSTFTIDLALKECPHTAIESTAPRQPTNRPTFKESCHVLIADDQPDNRHIARSLIESFGGTVIECCNGQEAVEQCQQHKFDVILMDLAMPVMDGHDATKQIRQNTTLNQSTPIIAVTADVTPKVQDACIAVGMQQYISKPIDAQELFESINTLV